MLTTLAYLQAVSVVFFFGGGGGGRALCNEWNRIRTTPHQDNLHRIGIGPDEWFYWLVVVRVGWWVLRNYPTDRGPGGQ